MRRNVYPIGKNATKILNVIANPYAGIIPFAQNINGIINNITDTIVVPKIK